MTLVFHQIFTPGLSQFSYLIGDDRRRIAAVVDPRADVGIYLRLAQRSGLAITHVFETHNHGDFLSGAWALSERAGGVPIYLGGESAPGYGFDYQPIYEGDSFDLGEVRITVHHTPGHSPEHLAFELSEVDHPERCWGVLAGDALLVGSVAPPNLDLTSDAGRERVETLYHTLHHYFLTLADDVTLYPGHGPGAPLGARGSGRNSSTIGYERRYNRYLQPMPLEEFHQQLANQSELSGMYGSGLKQLNTEGADLLGDLPSLRGLPPEEFQQLAARQGPPILDTREMLAFGGGHIHAAINLGARPELSLWAAALLDPREPMLLVVEDETRLPWIVRLLLRGGITRFAGYLVGGMAAWHDAGLALANLPQVGIHQLQAELDDTQLLDVRTSREWELGHFPGAVHFPLVNLRERLPPLDRRRPVAVYCDNGYRSSAAASLLKFRGFQEVYNVPGSWQAWETAGYPMET